MVEKLKGGQKKILVATGMTKRFSGLVAVDNLDFYIPEGSIASIIGPNGAGKTTFFNCITGFYQIDEGELVFDGNRIDGKSPDQITRSGIARTFQNIRLFSNMSAIENIMVGQEPHLTSSWFGSILGLPSTRQEDDETEHRGRELLQFVGLEGKGDMTSKNLSYGDQRRLEIGRALASKPKLVLLDEPTAGMNPRETIETTDFIRRLRDEVGITVVLIEHDMRSCHGYLGTHYRSRLWPKNCRGIAGRNPKQSRCNRSLPWTRRSGQRGQESGQLAKSRKRPWHF